ncbi:hypothetical protein [Mycetocola reblochoni]|uniref:Uncharacterized protein n=2 Tax=Mycetocola reblochoni TaxID=331618 RepID=A0A1R4K0X2_9MICO|nr:hypothetical protein [Mycetocola reblochoni]RLP70490.1 hypothetical protein D9V30_03015 [Mycetocola reblochoni]SJN37683.1 hypothetical protein FM119_10545 [Mycetocola reblochoni REB411]
MALNRTLLIALAVVFSAYNLVRGVITLGQAQSPWPSVWAMALYATATTISLWLGMRGPLPIWAAVVNLSTAIVVPVLVTSQLDGGVDNGYASWHVASIGALMTITIVLRQEVFGWAGILFLSVQTVLWTGLSTAVGVGISGALFWGALASLLTRSLVAIDRRARELADAEREAARWQAVQWAHDAERTARLERTTREAMPVLRDVILAGGVLPERQRVEAGIIESALRDEIRGRALITPLVRSRLEEIRRRGTRVAVLDEGGLDEMGPRERLLVLDRLAGELDGLVCASLVVRTGATGTSTAVTVVGLDQSPDPDDPEDDVVVWVEILRDGSVLRHPLGEAATER